MLSVPVFVGLDYHQDSVQVCVMDKTGSVLQNASYENDADVIATVVERHGTSIHAAIESCTGAADLADELAARKGWMIDLAHPGFVRRMKISRVRRADHSLNIRQQTITQHNRNRRIQVLVRQP